MIKLRPHHLLCIQKWRGYGYDENFSINFKEIADRLDDGEPVQIVSGGDDICSKCPQRQGDPDCRAADAIDERVRVRLELADRSTYTSVEISEAAAAVSAVDQSSLCAGCQWLGLCAEQA